MCATALGRHDAAWRLFSRAAGCGTVRATLAKMAALLSSLKAGAAWDTFEERRLAPLHA